MKSKIKKLGGTARQFEIKLSSEKVNGILKEVLEDIRKEAKVPGFRPGKAPLDIVQKKYEKDALDEVKRRLIPEAYQQALDEHDIAPVTYPEISDISIDSAGALVFKAKVDVYPEIKLRKYKGLKATKEKASVKDEEVEEALTRIRNINAEFTEKDSPIGKGDFGICDVEAFVDGKSISTRHRNMWIEANKESSLLGLGEELCGLKKGDTKDIDVTLPENYPDKKYAGKAATFNIEVKDVREKKLPDLDDDLAKKLQKKDMNEVRDSLHAQIMERKAYNNKVNMKNQIMEQLLKAHSFDVPESMVKRQLDVLIEKAQNELAQKGVDKERIESEKDKLRQQMQGDAENKVRLYFILDKIANEENIIVEDDETDEWLKSLAQSYGQPFENVKKYYEEKDLIGGLKEQLREEKTLDFLLSEAVITEKNK
ncbi:MAG: trigger factor [Candidatus Omnitrophota bacterium]